MTFTRTKTDSETVTVSSTVIVTGAVGFKGSLTILKTTYFFLFLRYSYQSSHSSNLASAQKKPPAAAKSNIIIKGFMI